MNIHQEDIELLLEKIKEINGYSPYDTQKWIENFILGNLSVQDDEFFETLKEWNEDLRKKIDERDSHLIECEKEMDRLRKEINDLCDEADSYCNEIEYYRGILSSLNLESLYYDDGDEEDPDWENLPNDEEPTDADEVWDELAGRVREEVDREIVTDLTERINQMARDQEQQRERQLAEIRERFFDALDIQEEEMQRQRERERYMQTMNRERNVIAEERLRQNLQNLVGEIERNNG